MYNMLTTHYEDSQVTLNLWFGITLNIRVEPGFTAVIQQVNRQSLKKYKSLTVLDDFSIRFVCF